MRIDTPATLKADGGPVRIGSAPTKEPGEQNKPFPGTAVTGIWIDTAVDPTDPQRERLGDMLWALFANHEFQFIR